MDDKTRQAIIDDLELVFGEYMAGGFGELEGYPELKTLLDEAEGYVTDAIKEGRDVEYPDEFLLRYANRCNRDLKEFDE